MHKTDPDLFPARTDPADEVGRQTVADVDADDDGKDAAEGDADRTGDGLQDTDDGRRTLDDARDTDAGEEPEKVIVLK